VSHVIWPEAALPFVYLFDNDIANKSRKLAFDALLPAGVQLITGANRAETETNGNGDRIVSAVYNSVLALEDSGGIIARADKSHLVPFGEYLPFQETLEAIGIRQLTNLPGGFAAGDGTANLVLPGLPAFTPLICYEIIFPGAVTPANRPGWLLNITDDSWFGETAGPYQHLHQARMRAVEEGLPVVRAANTGISAVIGPRGRVRADLPLGAMGAIDTRLPASLPPPIYVRAGPLLLGGVVVGGVFLMLVLSLKPFASQGGRGRRRCHGS